MAADEHMREPWTSQEVILAARAGNGCLGHSLVDEPVFVLCARDCLAARVVRKWATMAQELDVSEDKIAGAIEIADMMDAWREAHGGGKIPD